MGRLSGLPGMAVPNPAQRCNAGNVPSTVPRMMIAGAGIDADKAVDGCGDKAASGVQLCFINPYCWTCHASRSFGFKSALQSARTDCPNVTCEMPEPVAGGHSKRKP